jgi:hypothetical protein
MLSALLLAGCDIFSGTTRTVVVDRLPSAAVVSRALHAVPGVRDVTQREVPASTSWGLYEGVVHEPAYDQFTFNTAQTGGVVETRRDSTGTLSIRLYALWINSVPPKPLFDQTRMLLDQAYIRLRLEDPHLPPPTDLKETLMCYPSR